MKKIILILSPALIAFSIFYGVFSYFEKDIERFVLNQVAAFSEQNLDFRIKAQTFEFQFFPPSLRLENIEIQSKDPTQFGFEQLHVDNLRVHLDFIQALGGRLYLSSIVVEGLDLDLNLDALLPVEEKPAERINWAPFFDLLKKIPVYRLALIRSDIQIESEKYNLSFETEDADLRAFNQKNQLNIKFDLNRSQIQEQSENRLAFDLRTDFSILPDKLEIHEFDFESSPLKAQAHGEILDLRDILIEPQGKLYWKFSSDLSSLHKALNNPKRALVPFSGLMQIKGEVELQKNHNLRSEFETQGKDLEIDGFKIGDLKTEANFKGRDLKMKDTQIFNKAGLIEVSGLNLNFEDLKKIKIKAHLSSEFLDVHDFLEALNVGDLPLEAFLSAQLDCEGPLAPSPMIQCQAEAEANEIEIRTEDSHKSIIGQINEFGAKGTIQISDESVKYAADVRLQDDKGRSDGEIKYKEGFRISFASPRVQFKNIQNLANLKLEGEGQIQGETWGDSNHGLFQMKLDLKKVFFEDFFTGDPKASVKYQNGVLSFESLTGVLNSSRYSAKIDLDLKKPEIKIEAQAPALELADLAKAVARKAELPVSVSGMGSAFVKASGPLSLSALTYNVSLQSFRGQVAGESFDRLQADFSALKGEVKTDKVLMVKNKSMISVFGTAHPNGQIDVSVRGDQFLLEESENVSKLSSNLSGVLNFQLGLTGFILEPDLQFRGSLNQLVLEEQEFPNSTLQFGLNKKTLQGTASLLGQRLKSEFLIPLNENDPYRLKIKATDWNYATLFALIGGASFIPEYEASLSGSLDIASDSGGFAKSTGRGEINQLLLKRGNLALANKGPMEIQMKSGLIQLSNFKLQGEQTQLEVKAPPFLMSDLRLQIEMQTPLRLLQIFFPFMDELGGSAKMSVGVTGPSSKPEILGSAKIDNAFVKIKNFPHPFERISAAAQFSARKVFLSEINSNFAGGILKGQGVIQIQASHDLPTNITIRAENVKMNVPDGMRANGSGDLLISGNWFPFLLSGQFKTSSGLITKEFGGEEGLSGPRQSAYLPKLILENAFEPLLLDLQIDLSKGIAMKNSLMDGNILGQIQIKGPPTSPSIIGKITTEKNSKIFFRDKVFEVSTGNITFVETPEINPEIYFTARSRVSEYDVNLLAQGNAKTPVIRLTSSPPLSEPDIISLLALGVVKSVADKQARPGGKTSENDGSTASLFLDAAINNNDQVKRLKKNLGVDLQISSTYDDTKNASIQKYTLSKKLSEKFNLSTSRIQGVQNSNEVKLRYKIDNNVSAVGTFENRQGSDDPKAQDNLQKDENIFGVDLEYKKEFH